MPLEFINWLIVGGLFAVGYCILLSMNLSMIWVKGDLGRLEKNLSKLQRDLWDLQSDVRSMRVGVSTLERGQARLDDRFPEMSSAVRNLTIDMAAVKRWS